MDLEAPPRTDDGQLSMNPIDLKIIRRLSQRVNVLPIIAQSDTLTDEKLSQVKTIIRKELARTKVGFSVFGNAVTEESTELTEVNGNGAATNPAPAASAKSNGTVSKSESGNEADSSEDEDDGERRSRPVIKLDQRRRSLARSSSRSRIELAEEEDKNVPLRLDQTDPESLANVRFSAAYFAQQAQEIAQSQPKLRSHSQSRPTSSSSSHHQRASSRTRAKRQRQQQFASMLPFAVIMPESTGLVRRALKAPPPLRPVSTVSTDSG